MPPGRRPSTAKTSWTRRSAARPGELKAAALRLFAQHGYAATTIEDLARAARVTVGTVYRYFADKAALMDALVQDAIEVPLASRAPDLGLRERMAELWTGSRSSPHLETIRILVAEGANFPELVERYRARVLDPLVQALARAPELASGAEATLQARALLGQVLGASLLAGLPPNVPALVPQLLPLGAMLAEPGPGRLPSGRAEPPPSPPARPRYTAPDAW